MSSPYRAANGRESPVRGLSLHALQPSGGNLSGMNGSVALEHTPATASSTASHFGVTSGSDDAPTKLHFGSPDAAPPLSPLSSPPPYSISSVGLNNNGSGGSSLLHHPHLSPPSLERLSRENALLKAEVSRLSLQLEAGRTEVVGLRERAIGGEARGRAMGRRAAAAEAEAEALRAEVAAKHAALLNLSRNAGDSPTKDSVLSLVTQLEGVRGEVDALRDQLAEAVAGRDVALSRANDAEDAQHALTLQLAERNTAIQEAQTANVRLREDLATAERNCAELRNQLAQAQHEVSATASRGRDAALEAARKAEIEALSRANDEARQAIARLEARAAAELGATREQAMEAGKAAMTKIALLESQVRSMEAALENARREERSTRSRLTDLESAGARLSSDVEGERRRRAAAEEKLASAQAAIAHTERMYEERIAQLEKEVNAAHGALHATRDAENSSLERLRGSELASAKAAAEAQKWADAAKSLQRDYEQQLSRTEAAEQRAREAERALSEEKTSRARVERVVAEADARAAAAMAESQRNATTITALQPVAQRVSALESENSQLRARLADADGDTAALQSKLAASKDALSLLDQETRAIRSEMAAAHSEIYALREKLRESEVKIATAEASIPPDVISRMNAYAARVKSLEHSLMQVQASQDELANAAERWEGKAHEAMLHAMRSGATTTASSSDDIITSPTSTVSQASTVRRLRDALASKDALIASLRSELDGMRDEVAALVGELSMYRKVDVYSLTLHRQLRRNKSPTSSSK